ncbi:hypothetical protein N7499_004259 [Penicillium canescens]|nr:hypothetical protein N7499_004259 [Penicillium canescens]
MAEASQKDGKDDIDPCKMTAIAELEGGEKFGDFSVAPGDLEVLHQFGPTKLHMIRQSGVQMKKQFGSIAALGVAFSILNSWVGAAGSLLGPITLGGSVTVIWGCLAGAVFTTVLCIGVVEMASAMPGAGGPYHYTYILAWKENRNFIVRFCFTRDGSPQLTF